MKKQFRNYQESNKTICNTYQKMLQFQNKKYASKMKKYYSKNIFIKCNIWDMIEKLEDISDESDPDIELPQIIHASQTALSIESNFMNNNIILNMSIKSLFDDFHWNQIPKKYQKIYNTDLLSFYHKIKGWSWFPIIGLIHDLGKILLSKDFGGLPQWSVVGDTFPIGEKLADNYPFYDLNYHKNNKDLSENTYQEKCGFENVLFSWGHDEYLANVLQNKNNTKFPEEAFYIIRFHSFYSWHSPRNEKIGYQYLASEKDWYMLPLLKVFQKSDLYSKSENIQNIESIKIKYERIINKFIEKGELQF